MAAKAPGKESTSTSLIPPEEKFWKRYSPHHEAPLSLAGSFALHALGVGLLALLGIYFASLFYKAARQTPVDAVRLELPGGGGGGGGGGQGMGTNVASDVRGAEAGEGQTNPELVEAPKLPDLNPVERQKVEENYTPDAARYISQSSSNSAKALARLDDGLRRKLAEVINKGSEGKGGTGSGGGAGTGTGTGEGPGSGAGKATLNKREKRMLRWHMRFTAQTGTEYLAQLRSLGAILAFPIREGPTPVFKVVRELQPGGKALDEDVARLDRIYWIDDKPGSVVDILAALRLRLPGRVPGRFVAFMPKSLEDRLFEMERRYVENILKVPFEEDHIGETNFRVVAAGGGYTAELISVELRK